MAIATFADLQNAVQGFNDSLKSYSIQTALTNATQNIQQLQSQQIDEVDKRNQMQALSNELAMQLTGMGANGNQIQAAMAATQPRSLDNYGEMFGEGLMKGSEPLKQKAQEWKRFMTEDKMALEQLKLQQQSMSMQRKASLQNDQRFSKLVEKSSTQYANWSNKLADSEGKLAVLEEGLVKNDNVIIQGAAPTILAKAMGEVGALTEADKEPYRGSLALATRISQFFEIHKSGKLTAENRQQLLGLVKQLRVSLEKRKSGNSQILSKQLSKHATKVLGVPLGEAEAASYITGDDSMVQSNSMQQSGAPSDPFAAFIKSK